MLTLFTLEQGEKMRILIFLILGVVYLFAFTSEEVARKSYDVMSGYKSSLSKTTMILKNASGEENVRKMEISKLESIDGDKSLINFLYPSDIKDTKLLSYEVIGGDDKQWLYLPALKRVKRISSRNKSGSFMASEFSYEDISSVNYKNYTYSGEAKSVVLNGKNYFMIERIPKDKNSGYKRQVIFIEPDTYLARYGEYFDKQDRLLKKIYFKRYKKIEDIQRVVEIEMKNVQNNKTSILILNEDNIKEKLKAKEFTKRELK